MGTKKNKTTFNLTEMISLIAITSIFMSLVGFTLGKIIYTGSANSNGNYIKQMLKTYNVLKEEYDVKEEDLLKGSLTGLLSSVNDPYATLLDSVSFDQQIEGKFEGLGIQIRTKNKGEVYIDTVFPNSGALSAGLKIGDKLLSIDDISMEDKTGSDFSKYVREASKKNFSVKVLRNKEELIFNVTKKEIIIPSVIYEPIIRENKGYDYVKISLFSGTTHSQLKNIMNNLKNKENGLIIDLRDNGGGRLDVLEDILALFVDSSHVIYQTDDNGKIDKIYSKGKTNFNSQIVILTNDQSASASEMLTISLKENLGAIQVGTKTYGKGSVQRVETLSNGMEFKYTTKLWLSPKGTAVNKVGIEPDIKVEESELYYNNPTESNDNQLTAAINKLKE